MESDQAPRAAAHKGQRKLGFGVLLAMALFFANRGCSAVNASPSWIVGTAWFTGAAIAVVVIVWFWDHTNHRHWLLRTCLSLGAIVVIASASYGPIHEQYRREHPNLTPPLDAPPSTAKSEPLPVRKETVAQNPQKERRTATKRNGDQLPQTADARPAGAKKGLTVGSDSVAYGRIPDGTKIGDLSVVIGATDANGNTILNQGGLAVGAGARADPTSIAIGSQAGAGSISQTNSGGINVQQGTTGNNSPIINSPITVGTLPKRIQPQDISELRTFFQSSPKKAKVQISADQFSGAVPLPDDFYQALKAGAWPMMDEGVNRMIGFAAPGKRFQGAVVTVRGTPLGPNETIYVDASDPLFFIGRALEALRIPRIIRREPMQADGLIIIGFEGGFPE